MHLNEDDLILHYYGEAGDAAGDRRPEAAIDAHLASCAECGAAWRQLRRVMEAIDAAPLPEPAPSFERTVWARLAPELNPARISRVGFLSREIRAGFNLGRLVMAGTFAAIVLVVTALRFMPGAAPAPEIAADATAGAHREQVMLTAVSDHIEQSQVVLVELANAAPRAGNVNVSLERDAADDLVSAGRLYRETAVETGNLQLAALLEELEMVLIDIARGPEALSADQLSAIRAQIEQQELIFKLQVLGADVKARRQSVTQNKPQRTL
jgi:hypothetical protein